MGYIKARLAEGYTVDELNQVSDYLTAKWLNDPEYAHNLRPLTVFGEEKFESYCQCSKKWHQQGRPVRIDGKWRKPGEVTVRIDTVQRDEAFTRIIGSHSKPRNRIEEIAAELAGKSGIRRMSDFVGRKAWVSIWQRATEQAARETAV
nr:conserved phage C-terminal domain-containing protein [Providencia alcalifaciens]